MSENKINCMGVIFFLFYPSFLSLVIIYMYDKTFLVRGDNTIPFRKFKRGFLIFLMPSTYIIYEDFSIVMRMDDPTLENIHIGKVELRQEIRIGDTNAKKICVHFASI